MSRLLSDIISDGISGWSKTGDDLFYLDGKVGIGTSSPLATLHASGTTIVTVNSASTALKINQSGSGEALLIEGSGGLGYGTGAGATVNQDTSRTSDVTINANCGAITLVSAAGSSSWQSFTVTNSAVDATDVVIVNQKYGTDLYQIHVTAVSTGSFKITYATTGGTTTEQPVFNFAVIKASTS